MTSQENRDRYLDFQDNLKIGRFYHMYRQRYFETRGRFVTATSLILSSAAAAVFTDATIYQGFSLTQWFAMAVAILQAWELVNNSSQMAKLHDQQRRHHINLESELMTFEESLTIEQESKLTAKRHIIELDEPPIIRPLIHLCRNKVIISQGLEIDNKDKQFWFTNWFTTQIFR